MNRIELVVRYFPTMTAKEIHDQYGVSEPYVYKIARDRGLEHTPETKERIRLMHRAQLDAVRDMVDHAKAGRKLHRIIQREYERMWMGKPQLTKRPLRKTTNRAHAAKYMLKKRYGYELHPSEPYTMLVLPTTRRVKSEPYYVKRYGMKFQEV